ncbi:MAG: glycosyltransferase family 39 protein [Acidimicrobiia bacterium]
MGVGVSARHRAVPTHDVPDSPGSRPWADTPWILLGIAVAVAAGIALRFWCRSDLWADEALSVNIAKLPLGRIPGALRHDGAPPLYYLSLHVWMQVFGTGNAAIRSLSGVVGTVTLVPVWYMGRRIDERRRATGAAPLDGPNTVAWTCLLLFALSPFAIRYSTEARMYAIVMLLAACGYLAVARAWERPTIARLVPVALVTALLLYSHYWAFALLTVVSVTLAVLAVRAPAPARRAPISIILAIGVGALLWLPWLPTFLFQIRHTGTPWGAPVSPFGSWALAFSTFGGNVHAAGWMLGVLVGLGVFALALDRRHIVIDLGTTRGVRLEAIVAFATIALGLLLGRIAGTTFEARYASVAFPLLVVIGAVGLMAFGDTRVRVGVLALALALGAWGGLSNVARQRTQAFEVVPILRDQAARDDLVVFCPDVIGTDIESQLPSDLRTTSFPNLAKSSARIDWVDYADKVAAVNPATFAQRLVHKAGPHTIWFVYTDNGAAADQKCAKIADFLTLARPNRTRALEPNSYFFEHQGVYRYPVNTP